MEKKVCWLSAGVSSFIAGWLTRETVTDWIYIDIEDQHPDSLRFIKDCEKALGVEVQILRSDKYRNVEEVCRKFRFVNSPGGASCTGMLKRAVRKRYEQENLDNDLTYIWGFDRNEGRRAEHICENFPEFKHEFPLIERGLTKQDAHGMLAMLGIEKPLLYTMGYNNNNCIGCVKGGMWYWNKIRKDFPEVFAKRAKMERDIGMSCINGVFLDELDPNAGRKSEELDNECSLICLYEMGAFN